MVLHFSSTEVKECSAVAFSAQSLLLFFVQFYTVNYSVQDEVATLT